MPDNTPKRKVKPNTSKKKKITTKRKPKKLKPAKRGRWSAICREIETYVKCNADNFKIIKKDKRSYLMIKAVFTTEVRKNNNYVHQPYTQNVEAMQYKCFLVVDGLLRGPDEMTVEYADFETPIIYISLPEEVKYKLSDYK